MKRPGVRDRRPRGIVAALSSVARRLSAATLLASAVGASAGEAGAPALRDRLRGERAHAEAQYTEAEHACRARFAVSGCLQTAGARRREALTRLRQQEVEIDTAERRERAAARRARVEAKTGAASASAVAGPGAEPAWPEPRHGASGAAGTGASTAGDPVPTDIPATPRKALRLAASAPSATSPRPSRSPRPTVDQSPQEAAERAAFERKQRQAAAHREAIERRNAEAAKSDKPAAPLPGPDGSAR